MKQQNLFTAQRNSSTSIVKPMLLGAGVGLLLISTFLAGLNNPDPSWPEYWQLRPLIIVPLAGAMGGLFYYFMGGLRSRGGWDKAMAILISAVGFIVALWLGMVLGLDGTLWD
jgi:hypothetical protein